MADKQKTERLAAVGASASRRGNGGISKIVWWIMGIISTLIVAGMTGWIGSVYARVSENNDRTIRLEERMKGIDERLQEKIKSIDDQLRRIELKIDQMKAPK